MIFTSHHEIANWFENNYKHGNQVRISTFNYYLDITEDLDWSRPHRKNGSRRIIELVKNEDLKLLVGIPRFPPKALEGRYKNTERILKISPKYIKNNHFKMMSINNKVLIGGMNLDSNTENFDAMFLSEGKLGREAIRFFDKIWETK